MMFDGEGAGIAVNLAVNSEAVRTVTRSKRSGGSHRGESEGAVVVTNALHNFL